MALTECNLSIFWRQNGNKNAIKASLFYHVVVLNYAKKYLVCGGKQCLLRFRLKKNSSFQLGNFREKASINLR